MVQWVKNLSTAAQVAPEGWFTPWPVQWVKGSGITTAATAAASIHSLAWKLAYASGVAIKTNKISLFGSSFSTKGRQRIWYRRTIASCLVSRCGIVSCDSGPFCSFLWIACSYPLPTFFFFFLFRAEFTAYGSSQARGQIGAVTIGHSNSHSSTRSELCLQPTPHSNARSLTHWGKPGIESESSWILVITAEPHWELPLPTF